MEPIINILSSNFYIYIVNSTFIEIAKTIKSLIPGSIIITELPAADENNGYYLLIGAQDCIDMPKIYDVYQFEQQDSPHFIANDSYLYKLRNAQNVFDFSYSNIEFLKTHGIKAIIWRYIHDHIRIRINKNKYACSFIGSMNDRRKLIIDDVISCKCYNDLCSSDFKNIITKSVINLNIHYYDNSSLEVARIEELLKYSCFIISERSSDPILDSYYEDIIKFADKSEIAELVTYYTNNKIDREAFIKNSRRLRIMREKMSIPYKISIMPHNVLDKLPELNSIIFRKAQVIINDNKSESLTLPKLPQINDLPFISIITITRDRAHLFDIPLNNFYNFIYPKNKIEWIVFDDSYNDDLKTKLSKLTIPALKYIHLPNLDALSISEKRNYAIMNASHDIIVHMDDDDYYYPCSLISRVKLLISNNCECVGSNDYAVLNIKTSNGYLLKTKHIAEASMCFYRKFWDARKFYECINGEGYSFLQNRRSDVVTLPYNYNFIAFTHDNNYTKNLRGEYDIINKKLFNSLDNKTQNIIYKIK